MVSVSQKNYHKRWASGSLNRHRRRGYVINISIMELENLAKKSTSCPYCGIKFSWVGNKKSRINSPALDRINNEKEIRLDNTEIICYRCNATKWNRTREEFIKYCGAVFENRKLRVAEIRPVPS